MSRLPLTSLERKLELLEARFTAPPSQPLFGQSPASPETAGELETQTLGPSQLSNAASLSRSHLSSVSQQPPPPLHCFAFDAPSAAAAGIDLASSDPPPGLEHQHHLRQQHLQQQIQPQQHSWEEVSRAAEQHLAKVSAELSQQSTRHSGHVASVSSPSPFLSTGAVVQETPPPPPPTTESIPRQPTPTTTTSSGGGHRRGQNKRKSVPVKKPAVGTGLKAAIRDSSNHSRGRSKRVLRDEGGGGGGENPFPTTTGTIPTATTTSSITAAPSDGKQSPSSPDKSGSCTTPDGGKRRSTPPPPPVQHATTSTNTLRNGTTLYDFFGRKPLKSHRSAAVVLAVTAAATCSHQEPTVVAAAEPSTTAVPALPSATAPASRTSSWNASALAQRLEVEELQRRVENLQRELYEATEQLKAVSNTRTILHGALQSALKAREAELDETRARLSDEQARFRAALEGLVREQAERSAKQVRETLALDGARLGRIVYARAGLRQVETWEDGHASKQLRETRQALRLQGASLAKRREAAVAALRPPAIATASLAWGQQALEAAEELASVERHLANVARRQSDLEKDEQRLQAEKAAHIRALKRVASEDASRFRSQPKLHDRYLLRCLLGKGGFSEVWKAFDLVELRDVAVKIHQLDPRWSDAKKENFTKHVSREYEIHRNVRHPRIVSLLDVFEIDLNSFATVLECCQGTDLDTLLKERRLLPEAEARAILLQILVGMQYLSKPSADGSRQGIIHYDLKPGNILFDEFGDAKITDFGLSKIVDGVDSAESMELTSQGAGTYWYLPPECFVMDDQVRISNKVDVWSIGVIFYQMLYGKRPFGDGLTQDKLLSDRTMLNARQVRFPDQHPVSQLARQFLQTCLQYEQEERPTIAQLCEHPYLRLDSAK